MKWIFKYLQGISRVCLCFASGEPILHRYTDLDMAGDIDSRKFVLDSMITFAGETIS